MVGILDCFGHWHVPAHAPGELPKADAIAAHEFGDQKLGTFASFLIAECVKELAFLYDKPIIAQYPVSKLLKKSSIFALEIRRNRTNPDAYLNTDEVNRQIAEMAKARGWKRIILCAHPHHLWRAGRNLSRHGMEVLYPQLPPVPYDPHCSRLVMRTPIVFIPREICVRLRYLYKQQL